MPDETTLAIVFSKPPPYTEAEKRLVIETYRANRIQYLAAGKAPRAAKPKGEKIDTLDIEL